MAARDARVDDYIANSAEFAQPILMHLREVIHAACPEAEETIKWGFPHFSYQGLLCSMVAFKQHCSFGFGKGSLIVGPGGEPAEQAMGQFGRLAKLSDLPSKEILSGYIKQAMKLNEDGVKSPTRSTPKGGAPRPLVVPEDLEAALGTNEAARRTFDRFSPSHQREYIEWITEAKTRPTRTRRLEQAIAWLAEGKPRNWKYTNC